MPQARNLERLDTWLSKLLIALCRKNGGELRISGYDLDDVPERCVLFTDYDPATHEHVLRAGSGAAEAIVLNTEQQWARSEKTERPRNEPVQPSSSPGPRNGARGGEGVVVTDEMAAEVENRILRRAAERSRERSEREANRVRREV